jgi:hypothetical protein
MLRPDRLTDAMFAGLVCGPWHGGAAHGFAKDAPWFT